MRAFIDSSAELICLVRSILHAQNNKKGSQLKCHSSVQAVLKSITLYNCIRFKKFNYLYIMKQFISLSYLQIQK